MTATNKPSVGFWIISVIALLWNLMGSFQYLSSTLMKEDIQALMTDDQIALMDSLPSWYTGVFATAVFAGVLGSIFLLIRKKWAINTFLISLVAILIQMGYWLLATDAMVVYGTEAIFMPLVVIIIGAFLYWYSKSVHQKGWLK